MPTLHELLPAVVGLVERAGCLILEHYGSEVDVRRKADASPVTAADEAAEALILAGLEDLTPAIPVVAEERVARGTTPDLDAGPFWLVDPLDGTREFLSRNGEFTVNVALVEGTVPVLGVVQAPALGRLWWGVVGRGAGRRDGEEEHAIAVRRRPQVGAVALASRSHRDPHTDAFLEREGVTERISAGSSLKFCLIAEGKADVYPRFGPTMEWDTAAGQAVLAAAGGRVVTPDGAPFLYRKPGFRNDPFVARGG